jgi:hypothetical protein
VSSCLHSSLSFLFFFSVSACAPRIPLSLSDMHFYSMRYASSMRFSCCTQPAFPCMNKSQQKQPLHLYVLCTYLSYQVLFRSSIKPIIFFGDYSEHVHHHWLILRFFSLSGSATLRLLYHSQALSSLLQLQTSTLFHLSIFSLISLHSTDSYLETLQLL